MIYGPEKASSILGSLPQTNDRIIPRLRLGVWCGTGICQLMDCDNAQFLGYYNQTHQPTVIGSIHKYPHLMLFFFPLASTTSTNQALSCINHRKSFLGIGYHRLPSRCLSSVAPSVAPGRLLIGQHFLHQVIRRRPAAQPSEVGASLLALQVGLESHGGWPWEPKKSQVQKPPKIGVFVATKHGEVNLA